LYGVAEASLQLGGEHFLTGLEFDADRVESDSDASEGAVGDHR
jgi:hypothetical protein